MLPVCLIAQERYVIYKFEKMDYFVRLLGSGGVGLEKNKVQELLLSNGLSSASICLFGSRSLSLPKVVDTFICIFRAALVIGLKSSGDRLMWNRWMCSSEGLPRQVPELSLSAIHPSQYHPFLILSNHFDVSVDSLLMSKLNVLEHVLFWGLFFTTLFSWMGFWSL